MKEEAVLVEKSLRLNKKSSNDKSVDLGASGGTSASEKKMLQTANETLRSV